MTPGVAEISGASVAGASLAEREGEAVIEAVVDVAVVVVVAVAVVVAEVSGSDALAQPTPLTTTAASRVTMRRGSDRR